MPDINLTHDTGLGEQSREEQEKQKHKTDRRPTLTTPGREQKTTEPKPAGVSLAQRLGGFWNALKALLPRPSPQAKGRILHEERVLQVPQPASRQPFAAPMKPLPPKPAAPSAPTIAPPPPRPPQRPGTPQNAVPSPKESVDVNLVPEEFMTNLDSQNRLLLLGLVGILTLLLVGVVYLALSVFQTKMKNEAQANLVRIEEVDRELARLNTVKRSAATLHAATLQAQQLLSTHIYWTRFFAGLEKYTVDTVFYRGLSADRSGRLTLVASSRDFRSVARQLLAFRNASDFVREVSITSAAVHESGGTAYVDFTASITLTDDVFYRDAEGTIDYPRAP